jgi:starch synthase
MSDGFPEPLNKAFRKKLLVDGITEKDVSVLNPPDYINLSKLAIDYCRWHNYWFRKCRPKA